MSISSNPEKFHITVIVGHLYRYLVRVTLFDYNSKKIIPEKVTTAGRYSYSQYSGLYTLRVSLNGDIKDEIFFLDRNKNFLVSDENDYVSIDQTLITPPVQYSSALIGEKYGSSFEYYTEPSKYYSTKDTTENPSEAYSANSLYIFLRYPSLQHFQRYTSVNQIVLLKQFKLVSEMGELICNFDDASQTKIDTSVGWLAFNKELPAGLYYLIYTEIEPRQLPVYVFNNWHTQLFMTMGEQPQFGSIRIFLSQRRYFKAEDFTHHYIDTLLDMLQNNDYSLEENLIEIVSRDKFQSPMLGLLCSYIYLKGESFKKDSLFNIITNNLQNVILKNNEEAPDLKALQILAAQHFDSKNSIELSILTPPMFRIGFEAILSASLKKDSLIPMQSMNDYISENLFYDSPYTTFKPVNFLEVKIYNKNENPNSSIFDTINKSDRSSAFRGGAVNTISNTDSLEDEIETKYFRMELKSLLGKKTLKTISDNTNPALEDSWLKRSVAEHLRDDDSLNMIDLSNKMGVSKNTVMRALIELSQDNRSLNS